MQEKYLPAPGFENYYLVSNLGNIKRLDNGCLKKLTLTKTNYVVVTLSAKEHKNKTFYVDKLVWLTFYGVAVKSIYHKDGNRLNNCLDNLTIEKVG